jgi:hypothetical protein
MRVLSLVSLTSLMLAFLSDGGACPQCAPPAPTGDDGPSLVAETQPAARPGEPKKKGKSIDDEIKALGLRPCSISAIMGRWKSSKIEKKLKTWSENGAKAEEFEDAHKMGLNVAGMAKLVEWNKNKHRATDPKGHDQLITDMETSSRKLAEAAKEKDSDGVKSAAAAVNQSCNDCHSRFK